jgi:hypothetical protein
LREKVKRGDIDFKLLAAPPDDLNFEFVKQFTTHVSLGDAGAPRAPALRWVPPPQS